MTNIAAGTPGLGQFIALVGDGFFMQEQLPAGTEPFTARNHLWVVVVVHGYAPGEECIYGRPGQVRFDSLYVLVVIG